MPGYVRELLSPAARRSAYGDTRRPAVPVTSASTAPAPPAAAPHAAPSRSARGRLPCRSMPAPTASKPKTETPASTETPVTHTSSGKATAVTSPSRRAQRPAYPARVDPHRGVRAAASAPAASIISAAATVSSHTRWSYSASRAGVTGSSTLVDSSRSSGSGSTFANSPVAVPRQDTNSPSGTASHTPLGAPSRAAPAIRPGSSPVTAPYPAAAQPATTASSSTRRSADAAGRTTRCSPSRAGGSGARRELSSASRRTTSTHSRPPSRVRPVATWKLTEALASIRSCSPSPSPPPMSPMPGNPSVRPPPLSPPSEAPSRAMVSSPAHASAPSRVTNSTTTAPARAASSPPGTVSPAPRSDRRNTQASSRAPIRPTPSGMSSSRPAAGAAQTEHRDVTGGDDLAAHRHGDHGRRHRPQRARGVGAQQVQPQRRGPHHPQVRPAHRGDRREQHAAPRDRSPRARGRVRRCGGVRGHARPRGLASEPPALHGAPIRHDPHGSWAVTTLRWCFGAVNGFSEEGSHHRRGMAS